MSNDQTEWGRGQLYCSLRSHCVKDGAETAEHPLTHFPPFCVASGWNLSGFDGPCVVSVVVPPRIYVPVIRFCRVYNRNAGGERHIKL